MICVKAPFDHERVSIVVSRTLAALVVHQVTQVIDLTAMAHRRAQDTMRNVKVGDEKASRSSEGERLLLQQNFPVHIDIRIDSLYEPELIEVPHVSGKPRREPPVLIGFGDRRRRLDAKDLGAHIRMLECAV
jgi:hypothetical protein